MDYQNSKIYKIMSHAGDDIYIGSTTKQYLSQRMQKHKADYGNWQKGTRNKTTSFDIFDAYGYENCQIILIENYPCNSKDELNAREGHFISTLDCVNKIHLGRTRSEHYQANKESIKAKVKIYAEAHRETVLERGRIRGKIHITCECGVSHRCDGKSKHLATQLHKNNMDLK